MTSTWFVASGSTGTNILRSDDDTVTVPLSQIPTLSINKSIPPATILPLTAGQRLDYEYVVTNTGNVTLSNVGVDDTHDGANTPPVPDDEAIVTPTSGTSSDSVASNGIWSTLAPGDTVRFTATYIVNQQDIDTLQ